MVFNCPDLKVGAIDALDIHGFSHIILIFDAFLDLTHSLSGIFLSASKKVSPFWQGFPLARFPDKPAAVPRNICSNLCAFLFWGAAHRHISLTVYHISVRCTLLVGGLFNFYKYYRCAAPLLPIFKDYWPKRFRLFQRWNLYWQSSNFKNIADILLKKRHCLNRCNAF